MLAKTRRRSFLWSIHYCCTILQWNGMCTWMRFNIILPYAVFWVVCFLPNFVLNPVRISRPSHVCHVPRRYCAPWFDYSNNTRRPLPVTKLINIKLSPLTCRFLPPRPKYLPQLPVLERPQPAFFRPCEKSSFTPTLYVYSQSPT
jgi:hypothetical protein